MKLVLTQDVDGLGKEGEIVDVAKGYGRNFLLPQNKAIKATPGALKHAEARLAARLESERKARDDAEALASQLTGTRVVIAAQAGDEGKLFGSIQAADIVAGVEKFSGVSLERKHIDLTAPIKDIGLHEINVKLHADVEFPLTIDVIPA